MKNLNEMNAAELAKWIATYFHDATVCAAELLDTYKDVLTDDHDRAIMAVIAAMDDQDDAAYTVASMAFRGFWENKVSCFADYNFKAGYRFAEWLNE